MDIDTRLLDRATALLGEVRELVGRAHRKASDYPGENTDESKLDELSTIIAEVESLMTSIDKIARED